VCVVCDELCGVVCVCGVWCIYLCGVFVCVRVVSCVAWCVFGICVCVVCGELCGVVCVCVLHGVCVRCMCVVYVCMWSVW